MLVCLAVCFSFRLCCFFYFFSSFDFDFVSYDFTFSLRSSFCMASVAFCRDLLFFFLKDLPLHFSCRYLLLVFRISVFNFVPDFQPTAVHPAVCYLSKIFNQINEKFHPPAAAVTHDAIGVWFEIFYYYCFYAYAFTYTHTSAVVAKVV